VDFAREELLACTIARLIGDAGHVAVGAASPIPAAGTFLLKTRNPKLRISLLQKRQGNPFTEGSRELFDLAGQGRIDVFFLGGAQIDGEANINLVQVGSPQGDAGAPAFTRFPGSFGSAFMYMMAHRTILFREEHSPRVLVEKVDNISASGVSAPDVFRRGHAQALVTGRCVFRFHPDRARFSLESLHPGETIDGVRAATGFDFDAAAEVPLTPDPSPAELALLRGPVCDEMLETYPEFCARVFGRAGLAQTAAE
jgi:glutaconate CoA-transferase subunit B